MLERIGPVAYTLPLHLSLAGVHDVFLVSLLKKYLSDMDTIVDIHQPELQPNLTYVERPIKNWDKKEKELCIKTIKYVKVL